MKMQEVWLREGPVTLDPLRHLLVCTLVQAEEDILAETEGLTDEAIWLRPYGVSPIGFHIRHIAESIDRLLTYAEGRMLDSVQLECLQTELSEKLSLSSLLCLLKERLAAARQRVEVIPAHSLAAERSIGRAGLRVPLGSLLAHIAEHTQRHLGQITTTARLLRD